MTVSAVTKGRPAVSAMEKSVITTPSSRLPPMPPIRTWPCTISLSVRSVKRRTRSRPKSVIVNTSTPTTVSTAIAPMTTPSPTRTRFMSERLTDGEMERQPIEDLPERERVLALERVIRLLLLQWYDAAHAIVVDHLGDDRQVLRQPRLDAEVDTNGPHRCGVPEPEAGRDSARSACERGNVALAHDARVDEQSHVERSPEPESVLDTSLEQRAAPNRARLEVIRVQRGRSVAVLSEQILPGAERGRVCIG